MHTCVRPCVCNYESAFGYNYYVCIRKWLSTLVPYIICNTVFQNYLYLKTIPTFDCKGIDQHMTAAQLTGRKRLPSYYDYYYNYNIHISE